MQPGKIYVVPGRKRPAFVRKRVEIPSPFDLGLTALRRAWGSSQRRLHPADPVQREVRVYSAPAAPEPQYYMAPPPEPHLQSQYPGVPQQTVVAEQAVTRYPSQPLLTQPPIEAQDHVSETTSDKAVIKNDQNKEATGRHTCGFCGKYRSPNYQSRHPLAPGEVPRPSICRKCIKEQTSSEDTPDEGHRAQRSHHREKYHKKRRHGIRSGVRTESTEENQRGSSGQKKIRGVRRSRSISRSFRRSSRSRSSSNSGSSASERPARLLRSWTRGSGESIKVIERTRYVDPETQPFPPSRSRDTVSRKSSRYERALDSQSSEHDHVRTHPSPESRRPLTPYREIEYRYDGDHHEDHSIRPLLRRPSRSVLPRYVSPYRLGEEDYIQSLPEPYPVHSVRDDRYIGKSYDYDPNFDEPRPPPSRSVRIIRVTDDSDCQHRRHEENRGSQDIRNTRVAFSGKASYESPRSQEMTVESLNLPERPRQSHHRGTDEPWEDSRNDEFYPSGLTKRFKQYGVY